MTDYNVQLRNSAGEKIALFAGSEKGGGLLGFRYVKTLRRSGQSVLEFNATDSRVELFELDSQIEFMRNDPLDATKNWYLDFGAFHRSVKYNTDKEGKFRFTSRGRGFNDLLQAEIIGYPAGTEYTEKDAACETVAKEFVDENIGPSATAPPRSISGVFTGVSVEADSATGATWSGARANKNLLEILEELAEAAPGDFNLIGLGDSTFEFRWRDVRWGLDKTEGNADGNPAVVFSPRLGNVERMYFDDDRANEINRVTVLGSGEGEERLVITVDDAGATETPWSRRAVARDARDTGDEDELTERANAIIERQRARKSVVVTTIQTKATRYSRDWDYGDLVTVEYSPFGDKMNLKIESVEIELMENGKELINFEGVEE